MGSKSNDNRFNSDDVHVNSIYAVSSGGRRRLPTTRVNHQDKSRNYAGTRSLKNNLPKSTTSSMYSTFRIKIEFKSPFCF